MCAQPRPSEFTSLTFTEHLEELRRRLGSCLALLLISSCVGFRYAARLIEWLKRPAGTLLPRLAFFSPTEALAAYMKVAVVCGFALALPVLLYQVWAFVRPGLTWRERYYGIVVIGWGSILFALGVAFAYGVCLPMFLEFLLSLGGSSLEPVISISRYLSFVLGVMLTCGVLFELPLLVVVLTRLGIVTPELLRRHRGLALLVLVIVAAVVTPTTDALSLILTTIPLCVLYEVAILVASAKPSRSGRALSASSGSVEARSSTSQTP